MKLAQAIEGGLAGATTISLLTNTLRKIDGGKNSAALFESRNLHKRFRKAKSKEPSKAAKHYVRLAGDVLETAAVLGLTSLGKRKNAALRGALLGTIAGIGAEFLHAPEKEKESTTDVLLEDDQKPTAPKNKWLQKLTRVGLYTAGGFVAGKVMQLTSKKKKKK